MRSSFSLNQSQNPLSPISCRSTPPVSWPMESIICRVSESVCGYRQIGDMATPHVPRDLPSLSEFSTNCWRNSPPLKATSCEGHGTDVNAGSSHPVLRDLRIKWKGEGCLRRTTVNDPRQRDSLAVPSTNRLWSSNPSLSLPK